MTQLHVKRIFRFILSILFTLVSQKTAFAEDAPKTRYATYDLDSFDGYDKFVKRSYEVANYRVDLYQIDLYWEGEVAAGDVGLYVHPSKYFIRIVPKMNFLSNQRVNLTFKYGNGFGQHTKYALQNVSLANLIYFGETHGRISAGKYWMGLSEIEIKEVLPPMQYPLSVEDPLASAP